MPGKKKGFYQQCTARTKNKSKDPNQSPYHLRRGIQAKLGKVPPSLEIWGEKYQSVFRKAINLLQAGKTKKDLSRLLQVEHNIQWAWIDSLLTDAQGTFEQLKASKDNQISDLKNDIASGKTKTEKLIYKLEDILDKPTLKNIKTVDKKLRGIRSKINKTKRNIEKLARLESEERLHVCFGSKKLFNAQYHLKENGYSSHEEWLEDWRKVRSGNFYSVGKGSAPGNNPVTKVYYLGEDTFVCKIQIPKFLQEEFGEWEEVYFTVTGQRKQDLIYSLTNNKPVTIQIFRREHKNDNWYIHLTTYVQEVPTFHTSKNGCIGVDINAPSLDILYVKPDGNPGKDSQGNIIKFSLLLKDTWTEGQRNARLRDIAAFVVKLAETLRCSIALEGLDFSAKKATMRNSGSKKYNRMLCGLAYDGIRKAILNRAEKFGVFVHFVNPCNSSVIGCLKYQQRYGLNSAYSAAMVIGRIALGLKERIPAFFRNLLDLPVDRVRASDGRWK
ncbi:MAG: IS200/IS605 family accessory protein TnpB-related protein, partial [Cyanobacteria bacterium P01_C01_bin.38]